MNKKATREELLFMWMQLKAIAEKIANQDAYKGRKWRLNCDWDDRKAGPDFCLWIDDSSIDIDAPKFYNEAEPEPEKAVEIP